MTDKKRPKRTLKPLNVEFDDIVECTGVSHAVASNLDPKRTNDARCCATSVTLEVEYKSTSDCTATLYANS